MMGMSGRFEKSCNTLNPTGREASRGDGRECTHPPGGGRVDFLCFSSSVQGLGFRVYRV